MAKKKKLEKKKRKRVRTRDWEEKHEFSFTHDLAKHRRALAKLPETADTRQPALPSEFMPNGTVISHARKWAFVLLDKGGEKRCLIDERMKEAKATLLCPGDRVLVEFEGEDAVIRGLAARRNRLSRPAHEHSQVEEQVFAANLDMLVVVAAAAKPPFREGLIDRYLIAAEVGGVQPLLCVNKMDLVPEEPPAVQLYRDLGIPVVLTSCESGGGIDALKDRLRGKLSVFSGHSGVGKTSLLNAMEPDLVLHTTEISEATQKGRHTTSLSRLYMIEGDIRIIDTPGIRALGVWGISPEEVAWYFPEIGDAALRCRFRDCTHTHEPHCAVCEAVKDGAIPEARFASYQRIRASLEAGDGHTPGRRMPL
jgi:ribosome biogenesis GTPase / thiamine phosphate phosphatase